MISSSHLPGRAMTLPNRAKLGTDADEGEAVEGAGRVVGADRAVAAARQRWFRFPGRRPLDDRVGARYLVTSRDLRILVGPGHRADTAAPPSQPARRSSAHRIQAAAPAQLAVEEPANRRVAVAVDELALVTSSPEEATASARPQPGQRNSAQQRVQPAGRVRLVPAAAQRRDHAARRRRLCRTAGAGG